MAGKRKRARPVDADKPVVVKYTADATNTPYKLRNHADSSPSQGADAEFKHRLKDEVAQYLADIARSVADGTITLTDPDESTALVNAVLTEVNGHEKNAAMDASASRLLESLVPCMEQQQAASLLQSFTDETETLHDVATSPLIRSCTLTRVAVDSPYGSHLLELLLLHLEGCVTGREATAAMDDQEAADDILPRFTTSVAAILPQLVLHKYGSFVARRVLAILSGIAFEQHQGDQDAGKPHNGKRHRSHGGLAVRTDNGMKRTREAHATGLAEPQVVTAAKHQELLQQVFDAVVAVEGPAIAMWCRDQFAGPFMQALLRTCHACGMTCAYTSLVSKCLQCSVAKKKLRKKKNTDKDDGAEDAEGAVPVAKKSSIVMKLSGLDADKVIVMFEDRVGSHFGEVLFSTAPRPLYDALFRHLLRNRMVKLALHPAANFVLQSALAAMQSEQQVEAALTELASSFPELLTKQRGGVVAALVAAAVRHHTQGTVVCAALAQLAKTPKTDTAPAGAAAQADGSVQASQPVVKDTSKGNKQQISKAPLLRLLLLDSRDSCPVLVPDDPCAPVYLSTIGCALLCCVFGLPQTECQTFSNALAVLSREELVTLCSSPGGNRVVETFLEGPASKKQARAVYNGLKGQWDRVALAGMSGCVFVDKCFARTDPATREDIVSSLAEGVHQLERSAAGRGLVQRLHVEQYCRDPAAWKRRQTANAAVAQEFKDLFAGTSPAGAAQGLQGKHKQSHNGGHRNAAEGGMAIAEGAEQQVGQHVNHHVGQHVGAAVGVSGGVMGVQDEQAAASAHDLADVSPEDHGGEGVKQNASHKRKKQLASAPDIDRRVVQRHKKQKAPQGSAVDCGTGAAEIDTGMAAVMDMLVTGL